MMRKIAIVAVLMCVVSYPYGCAFAQSFVPGPKYWVSTAGGVNVVDGSLSYSETDMTLGENEIHPLTVSRSYVNPVSVTSSEFGSAFTLNQTMKLRFITLQTEEEVEYTQAQWLDVTYLGHKYSFYVSRDSSGAYYQNHYQDGASFRETGSATSLRFILRLADGTEIEKYGQGNYHQVVSYPNGDREYHEYEVIGPATSPYRRLKRIYNTDGYEMNFQYMSNPTSTPSPGNTSPFLVTNISSKRTYCSRGDGICPISQLPSVSYGYTLLTNYSGSFYRYGLENVYLDGELYRTMSYDSKFRLKTMREPSPAGEIILTNYYVDAPDRIDDMRISRQTNGLNQIVNLYYYENQSGAYGKKTVVVDPGGGSVSYWSNGSALRPELIVDENNMAKTFVYDNADRLVRSTDAEGGRTEYVYDDRGNLIERKIFDKNGADFLSEKFFFAPCDGNNFRICNVPYEKWDFRGNRYTYISDVSTGSVIAEISPPYGDGNRDLNYRSLTSMLPAPGVAWLGSAVLSSISRVSELSRCRISQSQVSSISLLNGCPPGSDSERYEYRPSSAGNQTNHELVGIVEQSGGAFLRTCIRINVAGRKTAEISPKANLSDCL